MSDESTIQITTHTITSGTILESWIEGLTIGAFIVLILLIFYKFRFKFIIHELTLVSLLLAIPSGTMIFADNPVLIPYLKVAFTSLVISFQLDNIVNLLKIKPFLGRIGQAIYIVTLVLVQAFWILEIHSIWKKSTPGDILFMSTSPLVALCREPWWLFTIGYLFYNIKVSYDISIKRLLQLSSKFTILTLCMILSIAFILADIIVSAAPWLLRDSGINPFWRLAIVFRSASHVIFLDDFKTVLDKIAAKKSDTFRCSEKQASNTSGTDSNLVKRLFGRKSLGEIGRSKSVRHGKNHSHESILDKNWPGLPEPVVMEEEEEEE